MIALTMDAGGVKVRIMCKEEDVKELKSLGLSKPQKQGEVVANEGRHGSMFVSAGGKLIQFVAPMDYMAEIAQKTGAGCSPSQAEAAAKVQAALDARASGAKLA